MGKLTPSEATERATQALVRTLKLATGFFLLSITLLPLAIGQVLADALNPITRRAMLLITEATVQGRESDGTAVPQTEDLIIPSTVLYEAFAELYRHGVHGREWIVALGYQRINGNCVVTHVYSLKCSTSRSAEAEPDYGDLAKALRFYESYGAQIAGFAHIHPWNARSVAPSSTDIETHSRWEETYEGRFIGIVFTNSGVFRIFHGKGCRFRPVVVGEGVKRIGRDLYELEGAPLP